MKRLVFLVVMVALAVSASAQRRSLVSGCSRWFVCPYVVDTDPRARHLEFSELNYRFRWEEIEVADNEAVVCVKVIGDLPIPLINRILNETGCSLANRGAVISRLRSDRFVPFLDKSSNQIKFFDGQGGRALQRQRLDNLGVRRRVNDPAVSDALSSD